MSLTNEVTEILNPSAPVPIIPGGTTAPEPDIVILRFNSKFNKADSIDKYLHDEFKGCGTLELVYIKGKFTCLTAGAKFMVGLRGAQYSSMTCEQAALMPNGFIHISNNMNYGQEVNFTIVPDNTLSMQIRPIPADRPLMDLLLSASSEIVGSVFIGIRVIGPRRHYLDLK